MADSLQIPAAPLRVDEFIEWAMAQPRGRFELVRGEIIAMAPERLRHGLTKHRVARAIEDAVQKAGLDCTVFPDGMTVIVDESTCYEPDCTVQCGGPIDLDKVSVDRPLILVEVLSPSTGHLDMSGKLVDYFRVETVMHYLIVDTKRRTLIHHRREGAELVTQLLTKGMLKLDPPGLEVKIEDMFIDEQGFENK